VSGCVKSNRPVKDEVKKLRQGFLTMQYCLPAEQSLSLAARVLSSILPADPYISKFTENLKSFC
jgi:hypothetical protein